MGGGGACGVGGGDASGELAALDARLGAKLAQLQAAAADAAAAPPATEAALRAKCAAQERLVAALREDNARLAARLAEAGPIPVLAVKASACVARSRSARAAPRRATAV